MSVVLVPFVVVGWTHRDRQFMYAAVIATAALVIAGQAQGLDRWLCGRWLRALGTISYSLYLVHVPVQGAAIIVVAKVLGRGPIAVIIGALISMVAAVAVSIAFWFAFERPASTWSRRMSHRNRSVIVDLT